MKTKGMQRIASLLLTICCVCVFSIAPVFASDAENINEFQVQDRITSLYKNYNKTGFTNVKGVYGKDCPNNHVYHRSYYCSYCDVKNVIKTAKIKKEYSKGITASNMPVHYGNGTSYSYGTSCCGFTTYAGFYIFANGNNKNCNVKKIGTYTFSEKNKEAIKKVAKLGDMIRFDNSHSAIYLATTDRGVFVIDSNWFYSEDCVVRVHTVPWSQYNKITFTRGKNRLTSELTVTGLTVKSGKDGIVSSWSAIKGADGYCLYRSTSSNGTYTKVATTGSTKWTDKSVSKGKNYYYKVRAYNIHSGYSSKKGKLCNGLYSYSNYSSIKTGKY